MKLEYIIQSSLDYTEKFCFENKFSYLILVLLNILMGALTAVLILGIMGLFISYGWLLWVIIPASFVITFLIYGYLARVFRDGTVVPRFNNLGRMFIDGIKLFIIYMCWIIPYILISLLLVQAMSITGFNTTGIAIILFVSIFGTILPIYLLFYSAMGVVRFSKTGKIREGLNYSALKKIIRTNGWIMYIISMIILGIIYTILYIAAIFLFMMNFIVGIIIALILLPPFMVFCARYIGAIYEEGDRDNLSQDYFFE